MCTILYKVCSLRYNFLSASWSYPEAHRSLCPSFLGSLYMQISVCFQVLFWSVHGSQTGAPYSMWGHTMEIHSWQRVFFVFFWSAFHICCLGSNKKAWCTVASECSHCVGLSNLNLITRTCSRTATDSTIGSWQSLCMHCCMSTDAADQSTLLHYNQDFFYTKMGRVTDSCKFL